MSGDGFVHRIVENLGGEVMQRALVRPADIHARSASYRFQALKDLDMAGIIVARGRGRGKQVAHPSGIGGAARREQGANADCLHPRK
ncbi:hypothetical protein GCM10011529_01250 [Polymorphobacter glacialis]|uniref:Uncharacterized protein n=1 Tax=Sandarakinorhabdus glacialis TaxID=1614636 RepID=A0A916ZJ01_9SPHN|nr:hypothetical protein GCM10011529_01250 [Polymorphobacter glacialis]